MNDTLMRLKSRIERLTRGQVMEYETMDAYAKSLTRDQLVELAHALNILVKQVNEEVQRA